jgi:hypothetical protein
MGTTVIAAVIALGAIGWAAALQSRTKSLEKRVETLEAGLPKASGKSRNMAAAADSDATAASSRRKGRAATATAPGASAPAADGTRSKP